MGTPSVPSGGPVCLFLAAFAGGACPHGGEEVVSGADWLSVLKAEGTMRHSLLMSLLRTFSTGWVVFGTYLLLP
jgi:hypothetical protein